VFAFFGVVPFSTAYRPGAFFSRPGELIPALFFGLAFAGYVWKGSWRTLVFEHWLLVSLLIGTVLQAAYMSRAVGRYDAAFDAAHLLKIASYVAVLIGLMISVYNTFRRETEALEVVRDINAQLAREITVRRETEGRLQHFLDTANDLIQSVGPDGRFLYVNRAWQEALGYRDHDLERYGFLDLIHPDSRKRVVAEFERVMAGERVDRMLVEFTARDGLVVICSGSANVLMRDGRLVATQAIFRNVTEQRRAERELAASRANLAALVENTGDTIWSVDREGRLITFNSAFALAVEARTGREPNMGEPPGSVFPAGDVPFYEEIYQHTLGGERLAELSSETVQGQELWFEIYGHPITDEGGVTGAVMFGKDVTRRIRAEEGLRLAKEDAEAANQAKSQFLASGRRLEMGLVDRLKAIIDVMPDGASVSLPVTWLRDLLDAEGDSPGMGRLLTLEEAGEIVRRSPSTVRTWLNMSRLDGFKLNGRTWRIRESALRSFIERQESGEHEPPTIRSPRSVELGDWRNHVR